MTAYYTTCLKTAADNASSNLNYWYSQYAVSAVEESVDGQVFNVDVMDPETQEIFFSVTMDRSRRDPDIIMFCLTTSSLRGGVRRFRDKDLLDVLNSAVRHEDTDIPAPAVRCCFYRL